MNCSRDGASENHDAQTCKKSAPHSIQNHSSGPRAACCRPLIYVTGNIYKIIIIITIISLIIQPLENIKHLQ